MFKKGESGNPSGRPNKSQEQKNFEYKCRNWADLFAFDKLRKLTDSENERMAFAAIKEILDRAFGTSVAMTVLENNDTPKSGTSIEELAQRISDIIRRGQTGSNTPPGPDAVDGGK